MPGIVPRDDWEAWFTPDELADQSLDKGVSDFTAEAMREDAKPGLSHLTSFEAVAVVTDVHWM